MRNNFSKFLLSLLVIICTTLSAAAQKPNILFIMADDMTFRDIGCYGGQAHTPNIDQFAKEGMKFTHCFQAAPMCSPTRHNIYTGLYPVKSGAYPNHTFVKAGTKSIVHYLKPLGYRVALSGKRHISPKKIFPFEQSSKRKNPDMQAINRLFAESHDSGTPFCLFACSNEPHSPWNKGDASRYPPDKIKLPSYIADTPIVRENFSRYLAEVTYFDGQVGRILKLLDKHKLRENTLVMILSEQGNAFPFAKWTCYSHGLQSAMLVRWQGKVKPNSINDALVEYVDITPTFIEAAGGKPTSVLEGKSLIPLLTGKATQHKEYVYGLMTTRGINDGSSHFAIRTVRDKKYRFIWNLNYKTKFTNACTASTYFQSMVTSAQAGNAKAKELVDKYHFRPEFELYDCEADPLEMTNLAEIPRYKEVVQRLNNKLQSWMKQQGDKGKETELDAILHQKRYRGLSKEEALKRFQDNGRHRKKKKKP